MSDFFGVTLFFQDSTLDSEEIEEVTVNLFKRLSEMDGVLVDRVMDNHPPSGSMSGGGFLTGFLKANISIQKFKEFMSFIKDNLSSKSIEMEVEYDNKKMKIKVNSKEDLSAAIQSAKEFIKLSEKL